MTKFLHALTLLATIFASTTLLAQDGPVGSQATKEHEFLQRFVGHWSVKTAGSGVTGKSVMKSSMLGKLWLVNSSELNVSGLEMQAVQMIGFDPTKKKYVGIWADSMMNYMWRYEGTVDESGTKLTLNAKGPSMTGDGNTTNYQDIYEFKNKDSFVAISRVQGADGKWQIMMQGTGTRIKQNKKTDKPVGQ